jgi:hypothetical protein
VKPAGPRTLHDRLSETGGVGLGFSDPGLSGAEGGGAAGSAHPTHAALRKGKRQKRSTMSPTFMAKPPELSHVAGNFERYYAPESRKDGQNRFTIGTRPAFPQKIGLKTMQGAFSSNGSISLVSATPDSPRNLVTGRCHRRSNHHV